MVPIVKLSIASGWRFTVGSPNRCMTWNRRTRFVELGNGVVEVEFLQHLAHVGAEPGDVLAQVLCDVGGVGEELPEVVAGGVVEGESGSAPELRVEVLDLALVSGLDLQHLPLGGSQHAIEPAQDGERQDHILVLAALEGVADQVRYAPDEADDLAVVHGSGASNVAVFVSWLGRLGDTYDWGWRRFAACGRDAGLEASTGRTVSAPLSRAILLSRGYASRREPSRRLGSLPPRPCGPLCRPEVGVPSRPRAFSQSAVRGFAALRAAVPV